MTRWVTSDSHFGHANMLRFKSALDGKTPMRVFDSVEAMDECLMDRWADRVKPNDHIYHLGDVTLERGGKRQREALIRRIRKLPGHKRLFLGNHDHFPIKVYEECGFEKIYATWRDGETNFLFSHFPLHTSTVGSAKANVHGHIHDHNSPAPATWMDKQSGELHVIPYINVSVEKTDYAPIPFEEVERRVRLSIAKFDIDSQVVV